MHVSDVHERHPLCEAFIAGAQDLGIPLDPDYNKGSQDGVSYYQRTIHNGQRWSAAHAFLRPAMKRPNVTVVTGAVVSELTFEGTRATGIRYRHHGRPMGAQAGREVVLSAGAIALLQLSGVGSGELLRTIGVPVRHELAGVGEGFQDHYAVRVSARVKDQQTLNERARGMRLAWEVTKWLAVSKGLLAFSPAHVATFLKSMPHLDTSDLQFVFTPASYPQGVIGELEPLPGMTTGSWQMRPESRGYVRALQRSI